MGCKTDTPRGENNHHMNKTRAFRSEDKQKIIWKAQKDFKRKEEKTKERQK